MAQSKYEIVNFHSDTLFSEILDDVIISEIPYQYISKVSIYFTDGSISDVPGEEINAALPVNNDLSISNMCYDNTLIHTIKVFIDIPKLERDVNMAVEYLFKK